MELEIGLNVVIHNPLVKGGMLEGMRNPTDSELKTQMETLLAEMKAASGKLVAIIDTNVEVQFDLSIENQQRFVFFIHRP